MGCLGIIGCCIFLIGFVVVVGGVVFGFYNFVKGVLNLLVFDDEMISLNVFVVIM